MTENSDLNKSLSERRKVSENGNAPVSTRMPVRKMAIRLMANKC